MHRYAMYQLDFYGNRGFTSESSSFNVLADKASRPLTTKQPCHVVLTSQHYNYYYIFKIDLLSWAADEKAPY